MEQGAMQQAAKSSPGPLEKAMGASGRSFGSLFHGTPPHPPVPSSRSPPQQQHGASRFGTTESSEQHSEAGWLGAVAGAAAAAAAANSSTGVSSSSPANDYAGGSRGPTSEAASSAKRPAATATAAGMAASPVSLLVLQSPLEAARWQQKQQPPSEQLQARPQQLFPDAAATQTPPSVQRSASNQGWATFGDEPSPLGTPFMRQASGSGRANGGGGLLLDTGSMGPLGMAMSGAMLRQASGGVPPADSSTPPRERVEEPWQQQHVPSSSPQQQPRLPPSLSQQQQQQQSYSQQQQQQHSCSQQQQQQQQAEPVAPSPPPSQHHLLDRVSSGWGPVAGYDGGAHQPAAHSPLPVACRHTAHSPLAQGMFTVQRLASIPPPNSRPSGGGGGGGTGTPRRGSSSGASVVASVGLTVQHDAFAAVAAAAAVDASERMPSHRHTSSGGSVGSGNPFRDPPAAPAHQAALSRQLTGVGRTTSSASSFGEWSAAWPTGDGPLGAGMPASSSGTGHTPTAELAAFSLSPR